MKKKNIIIIGYIILILLINAIMIKAPETFTSYFDLFFINIEHFYIYHLTEINYQYLICFCLFNNFIIYYLLNEISESYSFLSMVVYRCNTIKTFINMCKKNIFEILNLFIIIFLTFIFVLFVTNFFNINFFESNDLIICTMYLLKYFLLIYICLVIYNFMSICGNNSRGLILINTFLSIMLILDLVFKTHFITFSANMIAELECIIIFGVLLVFIIIIIIKRLKRIGDIL